MNYLKGNKEKKDSKTPSPATYSGNNITITASNVQAKPAEEKPWTKYYMTSDDFFDILRVAYDDTYGGSQTPWHPEDLYINISCVLEIVANTLTNAANLASQRPLRGVKEY